MDMIDTREKRASSMGLGQYWNMQPPLADDAAIGQADRIQTGADYVGITLARYIGVPADSVFRMTVKPARYRMSV